MTNALKSKYTGCIYSLGGCWLGHMIGAAAWPDKAGHAACLLTGVFAIALSAFRFSLGPKEPNE